MNILKLSIIMSLYAGLSVASQSVNCLAHYDRAHVKTAIASQGLSLMDKVIHKINTSPNSHKELLISQVLSDHLQQIHSAYEEMTTMISSVGINKKYKSAFEASQLASDKLREVLQDIAKLKEEDEKFKGVVEKYKVCKSNMDVCYVDINEALEVLINSKNFAKDLVASLKNSMEELQAFSIDITTQEAVIDAPTAQLFKQSIETKSDVIKMYLTIVNSAITELTAYEREIIVFLTINYPDLMDIEKQIKITKGLKLEKQPEKKQELSKKMEVPERLARAIAKRGNSPMGLEVISKIKNGQININNLFTQMLYHRAVYMEKMGKKPFDADNMYSEEPSFFFSIKDITEILQLILAPDVKVEDGKIRINYPGIQSPRITGFADSGYEVYQKPSTDIKNTNPMGELIQSFDLRVGSEKVTQIISYHNFNIDGIFLLTEGKSADMYKDFNRWLISLKQNFLDQVDMKFSELTRESISKPKDLNFFDKLSSAVKRQYNMQFENYNNFQTMRHFNIYHRYMASVMSDYLFSHRSDVTKIELLLLMAESTRDHSLETTLQLTEPYMTKRTKGIELSISKDY